MDRVATATQGLPEERLQTGTAASKPVGSLQHWLWHGKVEDSLERLTNRILDWDLIRKHSAAAEKLSAGLTEFETYMGNHRESTSNDGEWYRQGETIRTAFMESTIHQIVRRRFAKLQPMHWTLRGAHLLPQSRTKVLNNELEEIFRRWYPLFRPQAHAA
jgi:hypothetical protein